MMNGQKLVLFSYKLSDVGLQRFKTRFKLIASNESEQCLSSPTSEELFQDVYDDSNDDQVQSLKDYQSSFQSDDGQDKVEPAELEDLADDIAEFCIAAKEDIEKNKKPDLGYFQKMSETDIANVCSDIVSNITLSVLQADILLQSLQDILPSTPYGSTAVFHLIYQWSLVSEELASGTLVSNLCSVCKTSADAIMEGLVHPFLTYASDPENISDGKQKCLAEALSTACIRQGFPDEKIPAIFESILSRHNITCSTVLGFLQILISRAKHEFQENQATVVKLLSSGVSSNNWTAGQPIVKLVLDFVKLHRFTLRSEQLDSLRTAFRSSHPPTPLLKSLMVMIDKLS